MADLSLNKGAARMISLLESRDILDSDMSIRTRNYVMPYSIVPPQFYFFGDRGCFQQKVFFKGGGGIFCLAFVT